MNINKYDVVIVGGGPAGSAAGFVLSKNGKKVIIIDKEKFPRKKLCGGMLTEKNIDLMKEIYGEDKSSIRIDSSFNSFEIYHKTLGKIRKCSSSDDKVYFVDRIKFDNFLMEKAIASGCEFLNAKVIKVNSESVATEDGKEIFGDFIIGADGANSVVRKKIVPDIRKKEYTVALEVEVSYSDLKCYENEMVTPQIYFGYVNCGYGWVFPRSDKVIVGIGGMVSKNRINMRDLFKVFIADILKGKPEEFIIKTEGFPVPMHNLTKNLSRQNIILAGDAAGLVEPIIGEGIYFAMLSGSCAAKEILTGNFRNSSYKNRLKRVYKLFRQARIARLIFFNQKLFPYFILKIKNNAKLCKHYFPLLSGRIDYIQYVLNVLLDKKYK